MKRVHGRGAVVTVLGKILEDMPGPATNGERPHSPLSEPSWPKRWDLVFRTWKYGTDGRRMYARDYGRRAWPVWSYRNASDPR
jgi:hypothetical protein